MVCFPLIVCSPKLIKLINDDFDTKFVVRNLKEQRPFLFYVRVGERMATARGALTVQVPAPSSDTKHGRINRKKNLGQPSRAPHGWPSDVLYYVGNDLSQLSGRDKSLVRPGSSFKIPGITIRKIDEVGHPARGQVSASLAN